MGYNLLTTEGMSIPISEVRLCAAYWVVLHENILFFIIENILSVLKFVKEHIKYWWYFIYLFIFLENIPSGGSFFFFFLSPPYILIFKHPIWGMYIFSTTKKNVKRHIFLVRNKNLKFEATIFSETVTTIQSHIISMYKRFHSFYNQTEDHEILFRKWDPICSKFDIPCVNKIFIV